MPEETPHTSYECARAWVALHEVHTRINAALTAALDRHCQLSINDFEVLVRLQAAAPEPVRMADVAGVVSLSQPALSRLVTRLEDRELVARCGPDADRRAVLLEITPAGQDVLQRAIPVHAECIRDMLTSHLSHVEQQTLIDICNRLQEHALDSR